jgi:hypothetical protein
LALYNGATLEQARNHGLCTAMSLYAAQEALASGCQYGVAQLMTPGMAKGLSEKLGAEIYCTLQPFVHSM